MTYLLSDAERLFVVNWSRPRVRPKSCLYDTTFPQDASSSQNSWMRSWSICSWSQCFLDNVAFKAVVVINNPTLAAGAREVIDGVLGVVPQRHLIGVVWIAAELLAVVGKVMLERKAAIEARLFDVLLLQNVAVQERGRRVGDVTVFDAPAVDFVVALVNAQIWIQAKVFVPFKVHFGEVLDEKGRR